MPNQIINVKAVNANDSNSVIIFVSIDKENDRYYAILIDKEEFFFFSNSGSSYLFSNDKFKKILIYIHKHSVTVKYFFWGSGVLPSKIASEAVSLVYCPLAILPYDDCCF